MRSSSTTNIGNINPFRYRSYYYDTETGLYYLETRYYDPVIGRFINADSLRYLGDGAELSNYNLFAYCGNNPVNNEDPGGTWGWRTVGGILGGLVVVAAVSAFIACTGGIVAGLVLGLSDAVLGVVVGSTFVEGVTAGGHEIMSQTAESQGEDYDISEMIEATTTACAETLVESVLLVTTPIGPLVKKHPYKSKFFKDLLGFTLTGWKEEIQDVSNHERDEALVEFSMMSALGFAIKYIKDFITD